MYKLRTLVLVLPLLGLAACTPSKDVKPDGEGATVEDRSGAAGQPGTQPGAATSALPGDKAFQGDPLDNPDSPLATRLIYFDYDRSEIKPEYQNIVLAHGTYLAGNPKATVVLEGHTDERGSREYNIGLGDRRAQAVRRLLLFQGASDSQIQLVSYGEEKPLAVGHDETAWAQNRRVEIVYKR